MASNLTIPPAGARERAYWVGTKESCPIQHLTLVGVCLPRFTTARQTITNEKGMKINQPGDKKPGGIVYLTDAKVDALVARLEESVVRWQGPSSEYCVYGRKGDVIWTKETIEHEVEEVDPTSKTVQKISKKRDVYAPMGQDYPILGGKDRQNPPGDHEPAIFVTLIEKPEDCPAFFMDDSTHVSGLHLGKKRLREPKPAGAPV